MEKNKDNYIKSSKNDNKVLYRNLIDVQGNKVGKIFTNNKVIVIDDQELVAALDYKSNRRYTLPSPKISLIPNDSEKNDSLLIPEEITLPFHNKIQRVKVCFFNMGGSYIELIEPAEIQSPVTSFLEKKGEGIHHLAFEVPDVIQATLELEKIGGKIVSPPSIGFENRLISFVYVDSLPFKIIEFVSEKKSN